MKYEFDNVAIRMVKEPPLLADEPVNTPAKAVDVLYDLLHDFDREMMIVVNLKTDMTPINMNIVSMGTINASLAASRELLKTSILSNAAAVMLFHNHPSGRIYPSDADVRLTNKMIQAFSVMDIGVLDHIVLGPTRDYFSFRENAKLNLDQDSYDARIEDLKFMREPLPEKKGRSAGKER